MLAPENVIVAIAQLSPVFLDKTKTAQKACAAIRDAASNGARLIAFPESFLPAYPDWVWLLPPGKKAQLNDLYTELIKNSVTADDEAIRQICIAAKEFNMHVVMGVSERNAESSNATLYNTLLFIDADGQILGKHRKLIPTAGERIVWAGGDGSTINAFDTPIGKIGGLICWENYMPLARQAMYNLGTQIYIAATWDSSDTWLSSMKHIAKEGGMFVISCCMALHRNAIPDKYEFKHLYPELKEWINPGNSAVIGPDGKLIVEPVAMREEIIYAELNMNHIPAAKWVLDTAGHYARNDVFQFSVRKDVAASE
jgi:nitrilase